MPEDAILSTDDYLNLTDWNFKVSIAEGKHGNYYWLRCAEFMAIDFRKHLKLPVNPFCVLVTYWDWNEGAAKRYFGEHGWRTLDRYAISYWETTLPKLYFEADNTCMIIDHPVDDNEILLALKEFTEPTYLEDEEGPCVKGFWNSIEALQPYCYASYSNGLTFIANGEEFYKDFVNSISIEEVKAFHRNRETEHRLKLWKDIGPECGPETCVESNCDRLRIKLAVRCFIHQLEV